MRGAGRAPGPISAPAVIVAKFPVALPVSSPDAASTRAAAPFLARAAASRAAASGARLSFLPFGWLYGIREASHIAHACLLVT